MVSINTNLSSLVAQNNLTKSTNALNTAIERLTTGYKINHASDNAANYSIANDYSAKLSSYQVAEDNTASGLDLLTTAQDIISLMQDHGSRIHSLVTQAQNGTYGGQSLAAIQSEVNARISEINRLYTNAEYNGVHLFEIPLPDWAQEVQTTAGANITTQSTGFIDDIVTVTPDVVVTEASALSDAIANNSKIGIANADVLAELATLVNNGTTCSGKTIILTDDIDLSAYQEGTGWTPIGNTNISSKIFKGTFDGQGHKVTNLKINNPTADYQGLFGYTSGAIKNVGVVDADVNGNRYVGSLVGYADGTITNSYATGSVTGQGNYVGGLAGCAWGAITNSYSTGSVTGQSYVGGLAGEARAAITNSYSTGSVTGQSYVGGLVGTTTVVITNSYAMGSVTGQNWVGGLVGKINRTSGTLNLENLYSSGVVSGQDKTGSLIGGISNTSNGTSFSTITITNASSRSQGIDPIGFEGKSDGTAYISLQMDGWLSNITQFDPTTTLQVGIKGDESSQINIDTTFNFNLNTLDVTKSNAYDIINKFMNDLSAKSTAIGAASNRLESSLESISVDIENTTSSLSTIKDADVAKVSSEYIRQQILQQASATLLATANQTPDLALRLLGAL